MSSNGHIAALVNPPGSPRASFYVGEVDESDPAAWFEGAEKKSDSWWPEFATWLSERSGRKVAAPSELGGAGTTVIEPAPGNYVAERDVGRVPPARTDRAAHCAQSQPRPTIVGPQPNDQTCWRAYALRNIHRWEA
jgi:hypothetical protein